MGQWHALGKGLTLEFDDLALLGYLDQLGAEFNTELCDGRQLRDIGCAIRSQVHAQWGLDWPRSAGLSGGRARRICRRPHRLAQHNAHREHKQR